MKRQKGDNIIPAQASSKAGHDIRSVHISLCPVPSAAMGIRKRTDPAAAAAAPAVAADVADAAAAAAPAPPIQRDVRCCNPPCRQMIPAGEELHIQDKWWCWNCAFLYVQFRRRQGLGLTNHDMAWVQGMEDECGFRIE